MLQRLKKIISALTVTAMIFGIMPIGAFAENLNKADYEELNDGYLKVVVSAKNGGFLIDTVEGDKLNKADDNKYLLFPDENYDTSYTSFRVKRGNEVKDYIFGRKYGFLGKDSSDVTLVKNSDNIVATWSVDGLTFTQTVTLANTKSALHGMASISYGVKSTDGRSADSVQARVMLDTALGYQDYAVYELTKKDSTYEQIQSETVIDNSDGEAYNNALFGYDNPKAPSVTAYTVNASINNKIVAPYQIAFGHWNNLASSVFDFEPDNSLTFTNPYNEKYLTADSAYALYFDMGSVAANGEGNTVATNYGIYSNVTVNNDDKVAINFSSELGAMQLTDTKDEYKPQTADGKNGDFSVSTQIKNVSQNEMKQIAVAVYPQEGITPYDLSGNLDVTASYSNPFSVDIIDFNADEERQVVFNFNAEPLTATDYRKIEVRCYDVSGTDGKLLSENLIGQRSIYLLCPGATGDRVSFISTAPEIVYNRGTRHIYLAGQNFNLLKNKSEYDIKVTPLNGSQPLTVSAENFILDTENNTADLILDELMSVGTYQIVFDMKDPTKKDITSDALKFNVSDDIAYQGGSYGVVTIEKDGDNKYALRAYKDEKEYSDEVPNAQNISLLELRGDFTLKYENGKIAEAEAVSLETVDHKAKSTINISNCLDIEKGTVTVSVENVGQDDQTINIDIDGEVYTTGARTKVWSGVCAISSFENGSESTLLQYTNEGEQTGDVENSVANTNGIMLMWPGAASTAQTIAGMVMEFRYCQFGQMATVDGEVTSKTPKQRVIAFGAQLSPDFLVPSNFDWSNRKTSAMEVAQLKMASSNYTPSQLRDVQDRYAEDQEEWEDAEGGSLNLYIHDILFGGGFIGFNTSVEVEVPSYADGLPSVEGTLDLKVMNNEYTIGVQGSADMMAFEMEAEIRLRSNNGIPIPDKLYFYAGGFTPGINVDGMGVFWIKGAGGGIDNLFETIYPSSSVPPITLLLSGQFALFDVLSARGDVSISPRDLSIALSDVNVAGITLIDYAGIECAWYPELRFAAGVSIGIFDVISGDGHLIVEKDKVKDKYFWEGYATAVVSIPKKIPIFGGIEIGSADLGVNAEKIWGALHVLKIDAGVTYYWGGDVDFAFGKYDAPEPTIELSAEGIPVYYDEKTDRTLYMKLNNSIRTLASTDDISLFGSNGATVSSLAGKTVHSVNFGKYNNENGILTISYDAPSQLIAETYAKNIEMENYPIVWSDSSKTADDTANANANAMLNWNEDTKKATVTITVTDENYFNKALQLKTGIASSVTIYALSKLPTIDNAVLNNNTVTWSGEDLDKFNSLTIYAEDSNNEVYPLYKTENVNDIKSKSANITMPENMPSGEYTVKVVATTTDESANPVVTTDKKLNYTNPSQPSAPTFNVSLGGDYSIDLTGINQDNYDGYKVSIYEVQDGKNVPTVFDNMTVSGSDVITVGGQYTKTVTVDKNGNIVNENDLTEDEKKDIKTQTEQVGLVSGKQYVVGLKGYKNTSSGGQIVSTETLSSPVTMVEPKKADVTLKAQNAVSIDGTDTVKSSNAVIDLVSDMNVSGEWSLDSGEMSGTVSEKTMSQSINLDGLEDGTHIITFKGENDSKDGTLSEYMFTVDTLPPRLQISSPNNGGFFEDTVTVKGISDSGAKVYIGAENQEIQEVTVGDDGSFEKTVTLDNSMAYQNIVVYAADEIGNETVPVTLQLTNKALGNDDSVLQMYIDGKECSDSTIKAGTSGQLSLKVKTDNRIIEINDDSAAANRIEWNVSAIEGAANVDENGYITTDEKINGVVSATVDNQNVYTVLGGKDSTDIPSEKIKVNASAGTARKTHITINLDTAIEGMTADNFVVLNGDKNVELTEVKASSDNKTYTLYGTFDTSVTYTVTVNLTGTTVENTHIIASSPLMIKPSSGGGGGGNSGNVTYKITVVQSENGKISPDTVTVNKNESKTFTITADEGYEIEDVIVNGESVGKVSEYTFEKVNAKAEITAKFKKIDAVPNPSDKPEPTDWNNPFVDVSNNDWFYNSVKYAYENGLMYGVSETEFAPDGDVTRAMFVTVLYRTEGEPYAENSSFVDVASDSYYANAVAWAEENKIVSGVSDTEFAPDMSITREQMAAIVYRYAEYKNCDITVNETANYVDSNSISDYARNAVDWLSEKEIMSGNTDGTFAPQANSTRAQTAAVFMRINEKLK